MTHLHILNQRPRTLVSVTMPYIHQNYWMHVLGGGTSPVTVWSITFVWKMHKRAFGCRCQTFYCSFSTPNTIQMFPILVCSNILLSCWLRCRKNKCEAKLVPSETAAFTWSKGKSTGTFQLLIDAFVFCVACVQWFKRNTRSHVYVSLWACRQGSFYFIKSFLGHFMGFDDTKITQ